MRIYKYVLAGTVKHVFETSKTPVCGTNALWFAQWKCEKEELEKRSVCKRCIRVIGIIDGV